MDIKTSFLNGDIKEEVWISQLEVFHSEKDNHLVCKLIKSIYELKQASHPLYIKFHKIIYMIL